MEHLRNIEVCMMSPVKRRVYLKRLKWEHERALRIFERIEPTLCKLPLGYSPLIMACSSQSMWIRQKKLAEMMDDLEHARERLLEREEVTIDEFLQEIEES